MRASRGASAPDGLAEVDVRPSMIGGPLALDLDVRWSEQSFFRISGFVSPEPRVLTIDRADLALRNRTCTCSSRRTRPAGPDLASLALAWFSLCPSSMHPLFTRSTLPSALLIAVSIGCAQAPAEQSVSTSSLHGVLTHLHDEEAEGFDAAFSYVDVGTVDADLLYLDPSGGSAILTADELQSATRTGRLRGTDVESLVAVHTTQLLVLDRATHRARTIVMHRSVVEDLGALPGSRFSMTAFLEGGAKRSVIGRYETSETLRALLARSSS